MFKDELFADDGDVVIYLNSPGGDCIAASQIYTMLMDYRGNVTIKIDGIAASAASVIAMAGTSVLMAPTSLMMIHNPMTAAFGSKDEMEKAIEMLEEVKESIIADGMLTDEKVMAEMPAFEFSDRAVEAALINKITAKTRKDTPVNKLEPETEPKELPQPEPAPKHGRSVDELMERLHLLNN